MTASASESWARTAGGADSISATIEALTCCLTSSGMAAAVEVEAAPLPFAVASVVFSPSSPRLCCWLPFELDVILEGDGRGLAELDGGVGGDELELRRG